MNIDNETNTNTVVNNKTDKSLLQLENKLNNQNLLLKEYIDNNNNNNNNSINNINNNPLLINKFKLKPNIQKISNSNYLLQDKLDFIKKFKESTEEIVKDSSKKNDYNIEINELINNKSNKNNKYVKLDMKLGILDIIPKDNNNNNENISLYTTTTVTNNSSVNNKDFDLLNIVKQVKDKDKDLLDDYNLNALNSNNNNSDKLLDLLDFNDDNNNINTTLELNEYK